MPPRTPYPLPEPMYVQMTASDGTNLSGVLRSPVGTTRGAAVLLHPHPAHGGDRDVWLLPSVGHTLAAAGWAVLRLNFRGVGDSGGDQTAGLFEHLDAEAAIDWLRSNVPDAPRVAAVGWSFGATIGLRLGRQIDDWVGIAPPTRQVDGVVIHGDLVPEVLPPRRCVVVGSHDQFYPPDTVEVLAPHHVVVIPDADHFLFDRDPEVAGRVLALLADASAAEDVL